MCISFYLSIVANVYTDKCHKLNCIYKYIALFSQTNNWIVRLIDYHHPTYR